MSARAPLTIARMETLATLLSARFALMVVLCVSLVATSVWVLVVKYRQLRSEFPMREKQNREEVDTYGSAWDFMWRGLRIEKWPELLAVFGEGASGQLGRTIQVPGESYQTASPLHGNALFRAFETLDLVFVVKVILSLAALLIVSDSICGEKASGTLKLLLANPVGRDQVLIGKLLGVMASLLVPVILSFVAGGLMLLYLEPSAVTPGVWGALALAMGVSLLYLLTFLTFGLAVSCATDHPDASLLWLLFCWVMFIFAVPSAGVFAAEALYAVRPEEEVGGQTRAVWANANYRWRWVSNQSARVWSTLTREERRENEYREYDKIMDESRRQIARIHEARRQELMGQVQFARMLSWTSPATCYESLATSLLETDYAAHVRFLDAAREYGEDLQRFLRKAFVDNMPLDEMKKKVKSWPPFAPPPPEPLRSKLARVWPELLVLSLANVVFFLTAHGLFLRYDPT